MIPAPFEYAKPRHLDEAVGILAQCGADARILAGGQSLLPLLKARAIAPRVVVDIGGLIELQGCRNDGEVVTIGALATQAAVARSQELRRLLPILAGDAAVIGDPLVRKRGTFAGALAFADPAADWSAIALALDARVHVRAVDGERTLPIEEFFVDAFCTGLRPIDLLTRVTVPVPRGPCGMAYRKHRHPASGYALVGVAAVVQRDDDGRCGRCRVAVTGAGRRPVRARAVEDALNNRELDTLTIAEAAEQALEGVELVADLHAGAKYRAQLVRTYARRALVEAAGLV